MTRIDDPRVVPLQLGVTGPESAARAAEDADDLARTVRDGLRRPVAERYAAFLPEAV